MNDDASNMTCADFQAHLPELIGTGEDIASHPHLQTCPLCRELLADLESIAQAARELFPIADPPEDLWNHIQAAIAGDPEAAKADTQEPDAIATPPTDLSVEPA